jgi:hypothetical protein
VNNANKGYFHGAVKSFYKDSCDFLGILQMPLTRGGRITLFRRYLAIAMGQDLNPKRMQELMGFGGAIWGRWESDEMRPREDKLQAMAKLAARYGLTWVTPEWLDYGAGDGPPAIGVPVANVPTKPKAVRGEKLVRPEDEAAKRRKKNPRRA